MDESEILSALNEKGIVLISGEINNPMCGEVKLDFLSLVLSSHKEITILFDCEGGNVQAALTIYDFIRILSIPVIGIVVGKCNSAASIVLQACDVRKATRHSEMRLHLLNYSWGGTLDNNSQAVIRAQLQASKELWEKFVAIYARVMNKKKKKVRKLIARHDRELITMSAQEMLDLGLIDEIVDERKSYKIF